MAGLPGYAPKTLQAAQAQVHAIDQQQGFHAPVVVPPTDGPGFVAPGQGIGSAVRYDIATGYQGNDPAHPVNFATGAGMGAVGAVPVQGLPGVAVMPGVTRVGNTFSNTAPGLPAGVEQNGNSFYSAPPPPSPEVVKQHLNAALVAHLQKLIQNAALPSWFNQEQQQQNAIQAKGAAAENYLRQTAAAQQAQAAAQAAHLQAVQQQAQTSPIMTGIQSAGHDVDSGLLGVTAGIDNLFGNLMGWKSAQQQAQNVEKGAVRLKALADQQQAALSQAHGVGADVGAAAGMLGPMIMGPVGAALTYSQNAALQGAENSDSYIRNLAGSMLQGGTALAGIPEAKMLSDVAGLGLKKVGAEAVTNGLSKVLGGITKNAVTKAALRTPVARAIAKSPLAMKTLEGAAAGAVGGAANGAGQSVTNDQTFGQGVENTAENAGLGTLLGAGGAALTHGAIKLGPKLFKNSKTPYQNAVESAEAEPATEPEQAETAADPLDVARNLISQLAQGKTSGPAEAAEGATPAVAPANGAATETANLTGAQVLKNGQITPVQGPRDVQAAQQAIHPSKVPFPPGYGTPKPKYFDLLPHFDSPLDLAAYTIANRDGDLSKADPKALAFVRKTLGNVTPEAAIKYGEFVKKAVKMAADPQHQEDAPAGSNADFRVRQQYDPYMRNGPGRLLNRPQVPLESQFPRAAEDAPAQDTAEAVQEQGYVAPESAPAGAPVLTPAEIPHGGVGDEHAPAPGLTEANLATAASDNPSERGAQEDEEALKNMQKAKSAPTEEPNTQDQPALDNLDAQPISEEAAQSLNNPSGGLGPLKGIVSASPEAAVAPLKEADVKDASDILQKSEGSSAKIDDLVTKLQQGKPKEGKLQRAQQAIKELVGRGHALLHMVANNGAPSINLIHQDATRRQVAAVPLSQQVVHWHLENQVRQKLAEAAKNPDISPAQKAFIAQKRGLRDYSGIGLQDNDPEQPVYHAPWMEKKFGITKKDAEDALNSLVANGEVDKSTHPTEGDKYTINAANPVMYSSRLDTNVKDEGLRDWGQNYTGMRKSQLIALADSKDTPPEDAAKLRQIIKHVFNPGGDSFHRVTKAPLDEGRNPDAEVPHVSANQAQAIDQAPVTELDPNDPATLEKLQETRDKLDNAVKPLNDPNNLDEVDKENVEGDDDNAEQEAQTAPTTKKEAKPQATPAPEEKAKPQTAEDLLKGDTYKDGLDADIRTKTAVINGTQKTLARVEQLIKDAGGDSAAPELVAKRKELQGKLAQHQHDLDDLNQKRAIADSVATAAASYGVAPTPAMQVIRDFVDRILGKGRASVDIDEKPGTLGHTDLQKIGLTTLAFKYGHTHTLLHEAAHIIRELYLTDAEKKMTDQALAPGTRRYERLMTIAHKNGIPQVIRDQPYERFSYYAEAISKGLMPKPTGILGRIYSKVLGHMERLHNALRGAGYRNIDDIMQAMHEGKFAERGPVRSLEEGRSNLSSAIQDSRELNSVAPEHAPAYKRQGINYELAGDEPPRSAYLAGATKFVKNTAERLEPLHTKALHNPFVRSVYDLLVERGEMARSTIAQAVHAAPHFLSPHVVDNLKGTMMPKRVIKALQDGDHARRIWTPKELSERGLTEKHQALYHEFLNGREPGFGAMLGEDAEQHQLTISKLQEQATRVLKKHTKDMELLQDPDADPAAAAQAKDNITKALQPLLDAQTEEIQRHEDYGKHIKRLRDEGYIPHSRDGAFIARIEKWIPKSVKREQDLEAEKTTHQARISELEDQLGIDPDVSKILYDSRGDVTQQLQNAQAGDEDAQAVAELLKHHESIADIDKKISKIHKARTKPEFKDPLVQLDDMSASSFSTAEEARKHIARILADESPQRLRTEAEGMVLKDGGVEHNSGFLGSTLKPKEIYEMLDQIRQAGDGKLDPEQELGLLRQAGAARSQAMKELVNRKDIAGETGDLVHELSQFTSYHAHAHASAHISARLQKALKDLNDPKKGSPEDAEYVAQWLDGLDKAETAKDPVMSKARAATMYAMLGYRLPASLYTLGANTQLSLAHLARNEGHLQAGARYAQALKQTALMTPKRLAKAVAEGRGLGKLTPEETKSMYDAHLRGITDAQYAYLQENANPHVRGSSVTARLRRAAATGAMSPLAVAESRLRQATFLAALRQHAALAAQNMTPRMSALDRAGKELRATDPFNYAREMTKLSNQSFEPEDQAPIFNMANGDGKTLFLFQGPMLQMAYTLAHMARTDPKLLAKTLGGSVALGGVHALPMYSLVSALAGGANQLSAAYGGPSFANSPDAEVNKQMDKIHPGLGDLAQHGIPDAIMQHLFGPTAPDLAPYFQFGSAGDSIATAAANTMLRLSGMTPAVKAAPNPVLSMVKDIFDTGRGIANFRSDGEDWGPILRHGGGVSALKGLYGVAHGLSTGERTNAEGEHPYKVSPAEIAENALGVNSIRQNDMFNKIGQIDYRQGMAKGVTARMNMLATLGAKDQKPAAMQSALGLMQSWNAQHPRDMVQFSPNVIEKAEIAAHENPVMAQFLRAMRSGMPLDLRTYGLNTGG